MCVHVWGCQSTRDQNNHHKMVQRWVPASAITLWPSLVGEPEAGEGWCRTQWGKAQRCSRPGVINEKVITSIQGTEMVSDSHPEPKDCWSDVKWSWVWHRWIFPSVSRGSPRWGWGLSSSQEWRPAESFSDCSNGMGFYIEKETSIKRENKISASRGTLRSEPERWSAGSLLVEGWK